MSCAVLPSVAIVLKGAAGFLPKFKIAATGDMNIEGMLGPVGSMKVRLNH